MTATRATEAEWMRLGDVPPSSLADARLQLHHAAQIAVSAAISYLPPRPDDSHTALSWVADIRALVTEPVEAGRSLRIGVRIEDLSLIAAEGAARVTRAFALPGRTVSEAYDWLADVARTAGLEPSRLTPRKHYTIPAHAVAGGAHFSADSGAPLRELAHYWSNAGLLLDELARTTAAAGPVRCWPHHFDIATLIALPASSAARPATIGVGHSPGDEWYAEPYWYVSPYPPPPIADKPALGGGGHWHTTGWVGAALPASAYVNATGESQRRQVSGFIASAVAACRSLLTGAASS